jgi:riboflavin kinase/FMN adenylyltransferase
MINSGEREGNEMQRWRGLDEIPAGWGHCVVTIGFFDGVHRGHQRIISRAVERARELSLPAVVVTFDPHPSEIVRPGSHPALLSSSRLKAELLQGLGVDALCVIPFTPQFSKQGPDEFVHEVLVERLHASAVVVGENFRFGHKAAGTVELLGELGRRFGFAVEGLSLVGAQEAPFSSTYVRSCVAAGDMAAASNALGRPHEIEGVVVRGDMRGRELGFPTANIETTPHAAIPADGIYAGYLRTLGLHTLDTAGTRWPAAVSVGTNPTFEGTMRRVEAYVLDRDDLDLYGTHVALEFTERLRDQVAFDSVEDLISEIARDVERVRKITSEQSG